MLYAFLTFEYNFITLDILAQVRRTVKFADTTAMNILLSTV
jgi:hypothetical protein